MTALLFLVLATLLAVPLLTGRLAAVIDLPIHYRWAHAFEITLREGRWVPRWNAFSNEGLGDATFLHIHPLFYYAVATLNLTIQDLWLSIRWVVVAALWALGMVVYHGIRRVSDPQGARVGALVGAIVVQCGPFAAIQLQFSQALPILAAMPLAGAVLFAVSAPTFTSRRSTIVCACLLSITILTHILVGFVLIACVSMSLGLLVVLHRLPALRQPLRDMPSKAWHWAWTLLCALGLSAWYLVPAVLGRRFINPSGWDLGAMWERLDWSVNFIFPWIELLQKGSSNYWLLWLMPLPAGLIGLHALWRVVRGPRASRLPSTRPWVPAVSSAQLFFLGTWAAALFFSTSMSWFLWSRLDALQQLQFPWRFVCILSIASGALLGGLSLTQRSRRRNLAVWLPHLLLTLGATALIFSATWNRLKPAEPHATWLQGQFGQPEYLPAGVPKHWEEATRATPKCGDAGSHCQVVLDQTHLKRYAFQTTEAGNPALPLFFYPSWRVRIDGERTSPWLDESTGLMRVHVPAGDHVVEVFWSISRLERWGMGITLLCVLVLGTIAARRKPLTRHG